jgi:membrane protein YdbS with pleckstrin-like domain
MRSATAIKLSAPSFAEFLIGASLLLHSNVFVILLGPLMLIAFICLVVAIGIASHEYEQTTRNAWTWLSLAGVAQVFTVMSLAVSPLHAFNK